MAHGFGQISAHGGREGIASGNVSVRDGRSVQCNLFTQWQTQLAESPGEAGVELEQSKACPPALVRLHLPNIPHLPKTAPLTGEQGLRHGPVARFSNLNQMHRFQIMLKMELMVTVTTKWAMRITKWGCSAQIR